MNSVLQKLRWLGAFCVAVVAACGEGTSSQSGWAVTDSAGVAVSSGPLPQTESGVVVETPTLEVFEADGAPVFRVASVLPRNDGSFLVLDAGNHRVLSFDRTGALQASSGVRGDGPGEFQAPSVLAMAGDSVLVYDGRHRRITVLGPQLEFARDHLLRGRDGFSPSRFVGAAGPQSWIGLEGIQSTGIPSAGLFRSPVRLVVLDPEGPRLIAEGRGSEGWVNVQTEGGEITSVNVIGYPFYRRTLAAIGPRRLVVGDTDEWLLSDYGSEGTLQRRIRMDRAPDPFESSTISRYLNTLVDLTAEERRNREESLDGVALPPTLPAFSSLILDDRDMLWARVFDLDAAAEQLWVVFDESGAIGVVRTPARFTVSAVRMGSLWGVFRDEFDVESVRIYGLGRPSWAADP